MCFAVPEKEVKAVAEALQSRFREALNAGRLSQVLFLNLKCTHGLDNLKNIKTTTVYFIFCVVISDMVVPQHYL